MTLIPALYRRPRPSYCVLGDCQNVHYTGSAFELKNYDAMSVIKLKAKDGIVVAPRVIRANPRFRF